jgi:hypothetical protein
VNFLVDNDIAIKLAQFDLLNETCSMFGLTPSNTLRLASLRFVGLRRLAKQRLLAETRSEISLRIVGFCAQFPPISEPPDHRVLDQLSSPGIDPGEALLLAGALSDPGAVVLTGDRRCVRALVQEPGTAAVAQLLLGRIEILESVFLRLIDRLGYGVVRDRTLGAPSTDGMLDLAFRTQEADPEAHAREALRSAEAQIETILPGLLRHRP